MRSSGQENASNRGVSMRVPSQRKKTGSQTFEPLDSLDRRILRELQRDARIRIAELGRRVGLSPPAVAERVGRLEETGGLSFRAEVEPRALGFGICALVPGGPP